MKKNVRNIVVGVAAFLLANFLTRGAGFDLANKKEGVILSSMAATTSPSLNASRVSAMAGLAGKAVQTDRRATPSAWYMIPEGGLKGYDVVTSSFGSWLGETPGLFAGEHGHRLVTHVCGQYPVSKYWVRVTSSTANLTGGFFQPGKNDAGQEIAFNQNYVGILFGPNGKLDSQCNLETGIWEQGGDDVVYSNGQLPSSVQYDVWYRFGSTTVANITDVGGWGAFASDFDVTAQLIVRDGSVDRQVAVQTVYMAHEPLKVVVRQSHVKKDALEIKLSGGSPTVAYDIQSSDKINGQWTLVEHVSTDTWYSIDISGGQRFFRARAVAQATLSSASEPSNVTLVTENGNDD